MTTDLSAERTKAQRGFVKMMTSETRRREHPVQMSLKPAVVCLDTDRWQDVIADVAREGSELIGISTTGFPEPDSVTATEEYVPEVSVDDSSPEADPADVAEQLAALPTDDEDPISADLETD